MLICLLLDAVVLGQHDRDREVRLAKDGSLQEIGHALMCMQADLASRLRAKYPHLADEADDVVQDAFVSLLDRDGRGFRFYEGRSTLACFVYSVVLRRAVDFMRRPRETVSDDGAAFEYAAVSQRETPHSKAEISETSEFVEAAIGRLGSTRQREVLRLHLAGLSNKQVAVMLGIAEGRVSGYLCTAKQALGSALVSMGYGIDKNPHHGPSAAATSSD